MSIDLNPQISGSFSEGEVNIDNVIDLTTSVSDLFSTNLLCLVEAHLGRQFPHTSLINNDVVIAGGAVRDWLLGVEPKDVDIFHKPVNLLNNDKYPTVDELYPVKIHCVEKEFSSVEGLLKSFDFTINQCAVCLKDGYMVLITGKNTISHITFRELIYTETKTGSHPVYHAKRIGKMIAKGFTIEHEDVMKICKAVVEQENTMPDTDGYV